VIVTISLIALTLLGIGGSAISLVRWRQTKDSPATVRTHRVIFATMCVGSALVFLYRTFFIHEGWQPLTSHLDGLVLLATLLGPAALYLQFHERLNGLTLFMLPMLTVILAWAMCASWWTFEWFNINSAWEAFHLGVVYLGTACVCLSAAAGMMYLVVQRRLHQKRLVKSESGKMASLESIERLLVIGAMLGFSLITLGLMSGVILQTADPTVLGPGWWHTPKVLLAAGAWLAYALLVNTKRLTLFRGSRAAWLSIAGLVLLVATFAVVLSLPGHDEPADGKPPENSMVNGRGSRGSL